jgi:hypothetical protein
MFQPFRIIEGRGIKAKRFRRAVYGCMGTAASSNVRIKTGNGVLSESGFEKGNASMKS